jgi:hypothetical protein
MVPHSFIRGMNEAVNLSRGATIAYTNVLIDFLQMIGFTKEISTYHAFLNYGYEQSVTKQ